MDHGSVQNFEDGVPQAYRQLFPVWNPQTIDCSSVVCFFCSSVISVAWEKEIIQGRKVLMGWVALWGDEPAAFHSNRFDAGPSA